MPLRGCEGSEAKDHLTQPVLDALVDYYLYMFGFGVMVFSSHPYLSVGFDQRITARIFRASKTRSAKAALSRQLLRQAKRRSPAT
jgi:hypothetical protein